MARLLLVAVLLRASAAVAGGPVVEPGVAFVAEAAVARNGPIPVANAEQTCGSNTASYLAELLDVFPTDAKVTKHWPDIVPGKVFVLSGTVVRSSLGTGDLPFDHPFGSDLNFDVDPDAPFAALNQFAADGEETGVPDAQHVELEEGSLPHTADRPLGPATGQPWYELSDANRGYLVEGFLPRAGDRLALMGHWIIDCGHTDYETEIHPLTFMAVAHAEGDRTVGWMFYNPYHVTQVYSPDIAIAGHVDDAGRFADPLVKTFPSYLVDDVLRLLNGTKDHLGGAVLLEAEHASPPPWRVCAPLGTSGRHLRVEYHFALRPGVNLRLTRDGPAGCITVTATLGPRYVPQNVSLRPCALPWDWLNQQAANEAGVPDLDIQEKIKSFLPMSVWPLVDNTPDSACGDALVGSVPAGRRRQIVRDESQPFPLAGTISLSWD
jgi:hypothetical protein